MRPLPGSFLSFHSSHPPSNALCLSIMRCQTCKAVDRAFVERRQAQRRGVRIHRGSPARGLRARGGAPAGRISSRVSLTAGLQAALQLLRVHAPADEDHFGGATLVGAPGRRGHDVVQVLHGLQHVPLRCAGDVD